MALRNLFAMLQSWTGKQDTPYPDQKKLLNTLLLHMGELAAGTVVGTGAALDITTPFDPGAVILWNETKVALWLKFPTQADDDSVIVTTAAAADAAGGITLGTLKFSLGTDANINSASDVIHWIALAFRNMDGSS
jgi:hypothetical protein